MEKTYGKLIDGILVNVEQAFGSSNFYLQSVSVLLSLALAIVFFKIVKKFNVIKKNQQIIEKKSTYFITNYLYPLLLPILMIIFLSIGAVVFGNFFNNNFLFQTTIKLISLFIFLRALRILFNSSLIANLVGFFLIPAIILNITGLLEPTIAFLDGFAISIGKVRISIYTAIQAFLILSVVFWISGLVSKKTKAYFANRKDLKLSTKGIITKVIDLLVYCIVFIIILKVFGVDMTTFAVIGGAIGVGIGFGLQKISSNFISGIILLMEKSVKIGDLVELNNGDICGIVTHFGGRYTLIEAYDGKEIMVPNEDFIVSKVTNLTYNNNRGRVEIKIRAAYDCDIKKVQEIILRCAQENSRCLQYPAPDCFVVDFADTAINLILYFWVGDVLQGRFGPKNDVMIKILEKFKENNISIPFPQRDVFIKTTSEHLF